MVTEKVAIVIPALNEEAALHRLLAEIPPNFAQWVIVVDNGSTDATAAVAHLREQSLPANRYTVMDEPV